jgi:hypothetical protein
MPKLIKKKLHDICKTTTVNWNNQVFHHEQMRNGLRKLSRSFREYGGSEFFKYWQRPTY